MPELILFNFVDKRAVHSTEGFTVIVTDFEPLNLHEEQEG